MSTKPADHVLEKAIIRCKKAQATTRQYNVKKTIKAGLTVEKKLKGMIEMAESEDFGALKEELRILNNMVANMQKAVLEPLLESVETIERRMYNYLEITNSHQEVGDTDEEGGLTASQDDFQYDPKESNDAHEEVERESQQPKTEVGVPKKEAETRAVPQSGPEEISGDADVEAIQQRFFERLANFFELQAVAEERVAALDTQGKIAGLKVKPHSKGIQEKDGTFKAGYRQQGLNSKHVQHLSDLYSAAGQALPEFKSVLSSLVDEVGGFGDEDWEVAEMKSRCRAAEKAQEEYSYRQPGPPEAWLYDILRASINCKTYKQIADINKWLKENMHIVDCENRFTVPRFDGYRDIVYYIAVPYKDDLAFICEIQVHHKEFRRLFATISHKTYFRPYFCGPYREEIDSLRDLDMLLQLGCIDDQLMEFLLESTEPSQLKLFARLFQEKLEESGKALELYKRVLTMEESSYGKGNIITGTTYQQLGMTLLKRGDPDGALLYLREGLGVLEMNLGGRHPEVAVAQHNIADALSEKGNFDEALVEARRGLALRQDALGEDHIFVADSRLAVARILLEKAEYKAALIECRTALLVQETNLSERDEKCTISQSLIGDILMQQGEYEDALKCYDKVLEVREAALGKKHQRIADVLTCIGLVKLRQRYLDDAESCFRRTLTMQEQMLGNAHCDCAVSYSNLGAVLKEREDFKASLTAYRLGLSIRTKAFGRLHFRTSESFYDLGTLFIAEESYDDALNHYKECLAIRKNLFGRNHPKTGEAINAVGRVKALTGDFAGAHAEHKKALGIFERAFGGNHPEAANSYQFIGEAFVAEQNIVKGLENHSKALAIRTSVLGKSHPQTAESCMVIGVLLESTGDLAGAKMALRQAVIANETRLGEKHLDTALSRIEYGKVLEKEGNLDDAEAEFRKAVTAREERLGAADLLTAEAQSFLGGLLNQKGSHPEARTWHEKALAIRREQLGEDHPLVGSSETAIAAASE